MTKAESHELGAFIQQRRGELSLTLRDVAEKAKLHYSTVAKLESGKIENASLPNLQRLAYALDVEYEDLATVAGYLLPDGLPNLPVYLRTKHHGLTDKQIAKLENEVRQMEADREARLKRKRSA